MTDLCPYCLEYSMPPEWAADKARLETSRHESASHFSMWEDKDEECKRLSARLAEAERVMRLSLHPGNMTMSGDKPCNCPRCQNIQRFLRAEKKV